MPPIETILAVALAGFALSATPGPSMLYVLSRSMGQNRYAGLASALRLSLGGILLAVATALGLAAIFERYEWIVVTLRYAGSAYLIWLGAGMILNASKSSKVVLKVHAVENLSFSSIVWQGVWVELLNPKTVLFFCIVSPAICLCRRGGVQCTSAVVDLRYFGAADRYSVGYCHGITGAHCDQIHQ